MGRGDSTHGGWFNDINQSFARPVESWQKTEYATTIPAISTFAHWAEMSGKWNLWEEIHRNPVSDVALFSHPLYGQRICKDVEPLPSLSEAEFCHLMQLGVLEHGLFDPKIYEAYLHCTVKVDFVLHEEVIDSFVFADEHELKRELSGDTWSPNSCDYYDVASVSLAKTEGRVQSWEVQLEQ